MVSDFSPTIKMIYLKKGISIECDLYQIQEARMIGTLTQDRSCRHNILRLRWQNAKHCVCDLIQKSSNEYILLF